MARSRDAGSLRRQLVDWLRDQVDGRGLRGAVVGVSGGVDSAVVLGLAAEAVGPERCLGLLLPIESAAEDIRLAALVAEHFQVEMLRVELEPVFRGLLSVLADHRERAERIGAVGAQPGTAAAAPPGAEVLARANLKPRLRMMALYYFANLLNYLVLGTGNKAERLVGYFTKWGDGAADAFPLGDLTKAEVWALARELGVPEEVTTRPPTAGLWPGQTDEAEIGVTYAKLDRYLLEGSSGDPVADERIRALHAASEHKRVAAPIAEPR